MCFSYFGIKAALSLGRRASDVHCLIAGVANPSSGASSRPGPARPGDPRQVLPVLRPRATLHKLFGEGLPQTLRILRNPRLRAPKNSLDVFGSIAELAHAPQDFEFSLVNVSPTLHHCGRQVCKSQVSKGWLQIPSLEKHMTRPTHCM